MKRFVPMLIAAVLWLSPQLTRAQGVAASKSQKWKLSGRLQFQWLHDFDIPSTSSRTNDGFRVRRSRFKAAGQVTPYVDAVFYIEVRDNKPRLKDGYGRIRLGRKVALRFGQFKVPVWREEYQRSSGHLLLIERSAAAEFLADNLLSARHVGVEAAIRTGKADILLNLSNGAGEGVRETAGSRKNGLGVNNGKMLSGRLNLRLQKRLQVGLSAAFNRLGGDGADLDLDGVPNENRWRSVIAPDFVATLAAGRSAALDVEGGLFLASTQDGFVKTDGSLSTLKSFGLDLTARYKRAVEPQPEYGGLDGIELAGGIAFVNPNTDVAGDGEWVVRAGPGFSFGKNTRFQLNGELSVPQDSAADTVFRLRAQTTFNF